MKWLITPLLLLSSLSFGQTTAAKPSPFEGLKFLIGEWTGAGSGSPGEGKGGFSLTPELEGHVLVRRNFAEYPATKERPAFRHDDVMYMFEEGGKLRAIYFDSEGHVIHYGVTSDKDAAVFLSEGEGPRYRLTYHAAGDKKVTIKFEVAPPGGSEFKTYIEAEAEKK